MAEIKQAEISTDNRSLREAFEECREELLNRADELAELKKLISSDKHCEELIGEEIRLARLINEKDAYTECYDDLLNIDPENEYVWEMLKKAADLGDDEALRQVAEWYCRGSAPTGVDFDKAAQYALEYVRCGGRPDGFETEIDSISPEHNVPIDHDVQEKLIAAICKRESTPERKYYLARCLWDIEDAMRGVLTIPNVINKRRNENTPKAIALYREAADEGYFWAQYYLGMYLALSDGDEKTAGIAYLEDAKKNAPVNESLTSERKEELREAVEIIEKTLFRCTGKVSNRVKMLEGQLKQGNLSAAPELAIAYMLGEECPKDRDKAFDCAAGLLFYDEEFYELWRLMRKLLSDEDRVWLENKLNSEASKVEALNSKENRPYDMDPDEFMDDRDEITDDERDWNRFRDRFIKENGGRSISSFFGD